jgi:NADH:ubiquinone oxidoreductase subunit 4 (subunit M)
VNVTAEQLNNALSYLPAFLIIIGTLAVYAFYALFAVAGVVLAVNFMLDLLHKLLVRMTGRAR